MMVRMAVGVLLLAPVLTACGTTYGTHGEDLSADTATLITRDMSMSEVRRILGDPTRITTMGESRELWTYRYYRVQVEGKTVFRPVPPPDGKTIHPSHGAIYILFDTQGGVAIVRRG